MKFPTKETMQRIVISVLVTVSVLVLSSQYAVYADPIPKGWQASNIKAIGYSGLDGRGGAFKMAIRQVAGRWYLYMGHEWHRGWTIIDVTDATNPSLLSSSKGRTTRIRSRWSFTTT